MLFLILDCFLPFYPITAQKNEKIEKMKKTPGFIITLHMCTKNYDQMMHCSWDMVRDRCNCYFSFWAIFCPFIPLTTKNIKILKKWKSAWRYYYFTYMYQKLWSDHARSWDMVPEGRTDGRMDRRKDERTDGRKKWHIEVGTLLKSY